MKLPNPLERHHSEVLRNQINQIANYAYIEWRDNRQLPSWMRRLILMWRRFLLSAKQIA